MCKKLSREEKVWIKAWLATATDPSCYEVEIATGWADECLENFKARFPNKIITDKDRLKQLGQPPNPPDKREISTFP